MKRLLLSIVATAAALCQAIAAVPTTQTLTSPNGEFKFTFKHIPTKNGLHELTYSVTFKGEQIVEQSRLGVEIQNKLLESALGVPNESVDTWCENLVLTSVTRDKARGSWKPLYGERATVKDNYNAMTLKFYKGDDSTYDPNDSYKRYKVYLFDIEVRAYDEGVAFRYHFPEAVNGLFIHITGETTSFTMPKGTQAYVAEWAQGHYETMPLENWGDIESERPLTMRLPSNTYVSLLEAQMVDYTRGKFRLAKEKPSTLELSMYSCADIITPYDTPWRVIMAAKKPYDLINNNDIVLNLNTPNKIENTDWIKPGKVFRSNMKMEEAMKGVDFAYERGFQHVHLDARWYGDEMRVASDATTTEPHLDLNFKDLCDYAASRGIGVFVYVNQRHLFRQLDELLPLYKEWGISGIKFGFVQVGNQYWTNWMHEAVRKCAEYEIMVDIHDEYRPTGFSRTYPNLMTQEGISGNEEMPTADHNTTLPYTRMIAGAGDYTPCYFTSRVKNTKGHQLALPVIYYSPLQFMHWYDQPQHYRGEEELEFWHAVPTVWDDSRAIDGQVGEYVVQARRSADDWFVGTITNTEAREVTIDCSKFLSKGATYDLAIYEDDPTLGTRTNVKITRRTAKATDKLKLKLIASGGASLHFTKR